MDQAWLRGLTDRGARIENHRVLTFTSPTQGAANAIQVVPLLDEGIILTTGEDAREFLQGQLTNDVAEVSASHGQLAAYCTPKGRVLATLLIWPWSDGYALQLPRELAAPICQRLRMYVLRSRVKLELIGDRLALIGVTGEGAAGVLQTHLGPLPEEPYAAAANDGITAVLLPGERWQLAMEVGSALATWDRLNRIAAPVGQDAWDRKGIDAGVPTVTAATSDRFVPQMLNLDLIAGVSFSKGCYPGQEIVARAQYRGQVKRRRGASASLDRPHRARRFTATVRKWEISSTQ